MSELHESLEVRITDLLNASWGKFRTALTDESGNWAVRGFIDVRGKVYPMVSDTKVLSKSMEVFLIPVFMEIVEGMGFKVEVASQQNQYPDLSISDPTTGEMVALDLKSTYRVGSERVNGFTLGTFGGYFRERESNKNVLHPYGEYQAHLVLGVIYNKLAVEGDHRSYSVEEMGNIPAAANDFEFLLQPKWAIAHYLPGSGNTNNIGSLTDLVALVSGQGPFTEFERPEETFDDYWQHYLTNEMARKFDVEKPYRNVQEFKDFKERVAAGVAHDVLAEENELTL